MRFAEQLVDGYGIDADATWLLDHHEVHLLLQTNPDGRKQAETGLSWRKNTDNNYCANTDSRGADLNRNFAFQWGMLRRLERQPVRRYLPRSDAGLRARGAGGPGLPAGELPRPATPRAQRTRAARRHRRLPRHPQLQRAGALVLGLHQPPRPPTPPRSPRSAASSPTSTATTRSRSIGLYPTDGTTDDFGYGDLGVAAYTFELGTEFFQSCSFFESTILPGNLPALRYAAKVARTPYMTPAGPDALAVAAVPGVIAPGDPVDVIATLDDTRYSSANGSEPVQRSPPPSSTSRRRPGRAGRRWR